MRNVFFVLIVLAAETDYAADVPSKYALFIGVSKYQHADMNKPQLEFPEADAKELAEIFMKAGYTVDLLLGKAATQEAITAKLNQLDKKSDSDGAVVIGLFGHGVEFEATKIACYCPFDTRIRNVVDANERSIAGNDGKALTEPNPDSLIQMDELLGALRTSPAGNRILLADCCRNDPNRARGRAFGTNLKLTDLPENTAAFFACSANEQAFEHSDWGHGAFTKCLIDEINAAQGTITAGTLADKLRPRVSKLVSAATGGKKQTTRSLVTDVVDFQLFLSKSPTPALLIAPFEKAKARTAQGGWAKAYGIDIATKTSIGLDMVVIPPGEFMMGNEDTVRELKALFPYLDEEWVSDAHRHTVRITKPFLLGQYEVTIRQFKEFVKATGYVTEAETHVEGNFGYDSRLNDYKEDRDFSWRKTGFVPNQTEDDPVVNVSWNDSVAFCNWLSLKEGKKEYYRFRKSEVSVVGGNGYRLPTEAEWEYACRAGTTTRYPNGNNAEGLVEIGNTWDATAEKRIRKTVSLIRSDNYVFTAPVGSFRPNSFGLYDMIGNVSEWCNDWYAPFDIRGNSTSMIDPTGPSTGEYHVMKGMSFEYFAAYCRPAMRARNVATYRYFHLGIRVAASFSNETP